MSAFRMKLAVKQQTNLPKLPHGCRIYAYNNVLTNQVIYSLDRSLDNDTVLKQLPFAGKKTVPRALRKDHWKPFFVVKFGLPHQGLNAYKKLREWRKLHELSWRPQDVPKLEHTYQQKRIRAKNKEERQELGGARRGGARSRLTEWKMRRKMVIMDQKANSVADLAAVLVEQEAKLAAWTPEREKLLASVMEWLPKLVTEGKHRKERMAAINEEIAALEQKIKDVKATSGKEWALPLASKITNLNRDLKMKKTEYYQISQLPELFDMSRFAQNAIWKKNILFEALCEREFLIRWQHARLEDEIEKSRASRPAGSAEVEKLEQNLDELRSQLQDNANKLRELEANPPLTLTGQEAKGARNSLRKHKAEVSGVISRVKNLQGQIVLAKDELFRTGTPPRWLKREMFEKRVHKSLQSLLRRKPKLATSLPLQRAELQKAIDVVMEGLSEVQAEESMLEENNGGLEAVEQSTSDEATVATTVEGTPAGETAENTTLQGRQLSGAEERVIAKQTAIELMKQMKKQEDAAVQLDGHDKKLQLTLRLQDYGNYKLSTTWFTIFPDLISRFLTTMTSIAPKLSNEIRLSDVSVEWSNPLDAEYGREWPGQVQHGPMGFVRHTARSEKYEALLAPINDSFKYDAEGKLIAGQPDTALKPVPKVQALADIARSKELVRSTWRNLQRQQYAFHKAQHAFHEEQRDLEGFRTYWESAVAQAPPGELTKKEVREERASMAQFVTRKPPSWTAPQPTGQFKQALEVVERQKWKKAARAPKKLLGSKRKGLGHYGLYNLGLVKVKEAKEKKIMDYVVETVQAAKEAVLKP